MQDLRFFGPLYDPKIDVHIWGPVVWSRLRRAFRDIFRRLFSRCTSVTCLALCATKFHDGSFDVGPFRISASLVCHPGLTVGYRIEAEEGVAPICPTTNPPSPLRMVDGLLRIGFLVPT
jgi:hypothetical protein